MKSFEEVRQIVESRRNNQSVLLEEMLNVRQRYHADYVIPMPDMDDQPELPPLTPALVANAIDSPALMAAQVQPDVFCPPLDFTKPKGRRSREYARKREHAIKGAFRASKMQLQMYRMYRHMSGYATACMVVRPRYKDGTPIVEVRDPLTAYPEPKDAMDMSRVNDCAFIHRRSAQWVRGMFPDARRELGGAVGPPGNDEEELWDILEWWDEDQLLWGVLGPSYPEAGYSSYENHTGASTAQALRRFENKIGHCPVVCMPRITLDRVATQVAHNTGIIDFMGRLLMLDMIAAERNVFPDRYVVGEKNEMPRITTNGGNWADGRTGQTNILEGVRQVGEMRSQPDPMTRAAYDTLERNYKVSTGQFGAQMGENSHGLRTGRALAEMQGIAVDPRVMELQRIAEYGLSEIATSILATWEACWPEDKVRVFTGFHGNRAIDELEPAKHIEGEHSVAISYTIAGADVQQTTIALGQLYGTDAISLDTMRRKHPYIDEPEVEKQLVDVERIERAMHESVLMRAQNGELPLTYLATISRAIMDGKPIAEAIEEADREIREQQAAEPEIPEGAMVSPEMMPGLEAAGPGADAMAAMGGPPQPPQPAGPPIGPTGGQDGLAQLMGAMRQAGAA